MDMSYSFYVDKGDSEDEENENITGFINSPPDPFSFYSKRTREKWVDDNAVTRCKTCNCSFKIYRRRHHCYMDGGVYCDACTSYREKIPKVIKKIPTRSGREEPIDYNTPVRLCKTCYDKLTSIHKLEKLFTVFSLLKLDLVDFKTISCVNGI